MATAHKSKLSRNIGKPRTMLAIGVLGLLGLIVAVGFSLRAQLDNLKIELALANERTISLKREVNQIRQDQSSAAAMLARLNDRLSAMAKPTSPQNNSLITATESKLIREFLVKIDAFRPMVEAGHQVGDTIPDDKLLDFSVLVTEKVPTLRNTKYTIDQNGSIIVVSENRIITILDFVNVAR